MQISISEWLFAKPTQNNLPEIKVCIFDLDGVIVETNHFHYLAWRRLADDLGISFTEKDNEQLKGVSRKGSLERILKMGDKTLPESEFKDMMSRKNAWYLDYLKDMNPSDALPGVIPFIESLRSKGIKISLASSSKNARRIIDTLQINHLFDAIKDGTDVTKAKPDPEIFLAAAQALKTAPENCVVFEDAIAGIKAAINAGMRTVGVGEKSILTEADFVIPSFEQFNYSIFIEQFDKIPTA